MTPCSARLLDSFDDQERGGVAQGGENAAGVQPARAEFAEDAVPVEVARLELAGGGMAAVGNAHRAAHAEAALGEVQAVAHRAAHAVEGRPLDEFRVHAALQNKILQQPADFVVGKGGGDGGFQAKAAPQAARDVVFAAAFPDLEFARATDAAFAGVEAEHDFAEGEHVVFAGGRVTELEECGRWHGVFGE